MTNYGKRLFALLLCILVCFSATQVFASEKRGKEKENTKFFGLSKPGIDKSVRSSGGDLGLKVTVSGSSSDFRCIRCGFNKEVEIAVDASVDFGSLKYQWYKLKPNNVNYDTGEFSYTDKDEISGATANSYVVPARTNKVTVYYACIVSDDYGDTASALFVIEATYEVYEPNIGRSPTGFKLFGMFAYSIAEGYQYTDSQYGNFQKTSDCRYTLPTEYIIYRQKNNGKIKTIEVIEVLDPEIINDPHVVWEDYVMDYTDTAVEMGEAYYYSYSAYLNGAWTQRVGFLGGKYNPFIDVSLTDANAEYIAWAYNNEIVKGEIRDDGFRYFDPNGLTSRMNFVMILWKMHGAPVIKGKNPFTDVSGTKSVNAVKWAVKQGIVKGVNATHFAPDAALSRINIVMILWKLAGSPSVSGTIPFTDVSGSKSIKAVKWAYNKGIITGVDKTHFDPKGKCSRALFVEILYKYNKIYKLLK